MGAQPGLARGTRQAWVTAPHGPGPGAARGDRTAGVGDLGAQALDSVPRAGGGSV